MTTLTSPDRPGPDGPFTDNDFGKALLQAMDDFAHSTPAPAFDSERIVRRTRRRRAVLALAGSAAAIAAAVTLTISLAPSPKPAVTAAAPPVPSAAPTGAPSPSAAVGLPSVAESGDPALRTATVPDLAGLSRAQAEQLLAAAKLQGSFGFTEQPSAVRMFPSSAHLAGPDGSIPSRTIVGTSPAAGARVAPGAFITVFTIP